MGTVNSVCFRLNTDHGEVGQADRGANRKARGDHDQRVDDKTIKANEADVGGKNEVKRGAQS